MLIHYTKMQGAGNEIVVIDQRKENHPPPSREAIRAIGRPGQGPGFDQLMWLGPARTEGAAASYRVFNRDGSEVEQCGNGVRCVARLLAGAGATGQSMLLDSPVGGIEAELLDDGRVKVNMGAPVFEPSQIPFIADEQRDVYELDVAGRSHRVSVLSMGNPHCVLRVDSIASADLDRLGPAIEEHERFPEGSNVGFMQIVDRSAIALRVWERGVGETLACGTGACAAVVSGRRSGILDQEVAARLPGGELVVSWRGGSEPVWLTGNADLISEGTIDL